MYMKTTSLDLYCTAHVSEIQLGLAINAAVRCNGKDSLLKCGEGGNLRFLGEFSVNRTIVQIVRNSGASRVIRETWQVCIWWCNFYLGIVYRINDISSKLVTIPHC